MAGSTRSEGDGEPEEDGARDRERDRRERRRVRQQALAQRLVERLRTIDPELARQLTEAGLARPEPGTPTSAPPARPIGNPFDYAERLLERAVERKPSMLATIGLSAMQLLSEAVDREGPGVATPLTVVFTDLEGFTGFTEAGGDDAARELLARHHRTVGPLVRSRGGRVTKRLGDGLLITFPEPEAAVMCALEMVEARPEPLRLRAGMHTGEVLVMRDDVVGHVVNVAARVADDAAGGEVLITEAVRDASLDLPGVVMSPLAARMFRGVTEPVKVCSVMRQ